MASHINPAVKGKEGFNELDFFDREDSQRFLFFQECDVDSLCNYSHGDQIRAKGGLKSMEPTMINIFCKCLSQNIFSCLALDERKSS